jgi:hypothetical protein
MAEQLLTWLRDGTTVAYAVPLVVVLVNVIKRIPALANINAGYIHLAVQVAFWAAYVVVGQYGHGEQLQGFVEVLTPFLEALLPFFLSVFGAHTVYQAATARGVPGLGYQRTEPEA